MRNYTHSDWFFGKAPCTRGCCVYWFVNEHARETATKPKIQARRVYQGQTLIELLVFIVVIGIVLAASISTFQTVLRYNNRPGTILVASQLADARMNIIIQHRRVNGFSNISDPCSSGSMAACAGLNTFAMNGGYVVSSTISAVSNGAQTVTVTVNGAGNATNVVRFVQ